MKRVLFIAFFALLFGSVNTSAQTLNPYYQSLVTNVSYDSVLLHLQEFQNFGIKSIGSLPIRNTGEWLYNKYLSYGYSPVRRDSFSAGPYTTYNIIATKTGTLYPDIYIIVCGHYDTNTGTGTNDNGSGVASILEIARIMANVSTEYSVKFINFSGEESGYLGSSNYVDNTVAPENMEILLVFNIDEVGGVAGDINNTVRCEKDNSSPTSNNSVSSQYTDTLTVLTSQYSELSTVITNAYGSDYVPFENNGEIITGFYEDNESSVVHSSQDNLAHLDTSYVYEIAKAATGATLYFARAYDAVTEAMEALDNSNKTTLFPNPCNDFIEVSSTNHRTIGISDINGKVISATKIIDGQNIRVNTTNLSKGVYIVTIFHNDSQESETFKLLKL